MTDYKKLTNETDTKTLMVCKMTRREFIQRTATAGMVLGVIPLFPGCRRHDHNNNQGINDEGQEGITNPFDSYTLGDSYFINDDSLSHIYSAFDSESLAKLTTSSSKSLSKEIITTTNRASKEEDDFSVNIGATAKAKFGIGAASLSNVYNRSKSKVNADNKLTWTSSAVKTGSIFNIWWNNITYSELYACLNLSPRNDLAKIFDVYGRTVEMIKEGKINTTDGKKVFAEYQQAVTDWYSNYGYGFVSGLWVGMLGRAVLTISRKTTNVVATYNNSSSVSYSTPATAAKLDVAFSGLSQNYKDDVYGSASVYIMPNNADMAAWQSLWSSKFTDKLSSYTSMLSISDTSAAPYSGKVADPPNIDYTSEKKEVDSSVSSKFQVTDKGSAIACAQVLDWEKNGGDKSFEEYLATKETAKKKTMDKYDGKDQGNFEDNVKNTVNQNSAVSLVKTNEAPLLSASKLASSDPVWHNFMKDWTTLGVYITKWSDVIPPLALASDVSAIDGEMTSGLVYLWGVRYQTQLIRFADYLDMCYPYVAKNAWNTENITSFVGQLRGFATEIEIAMKAKLEDKSCTVQEFYEDLSNVRSRQLTEMYIRKMYDCWSANYEFFKQADFGCGLVMCPVGGSILDPSIVPLFIFAGMNGIKCSASKDPYSGLVISAGMQVNWSKSTKDSHDYIRDPNIFAGYPKLLPLISIEGKIMFLMIGTNREEDTAVSGILDAGMMCLYRDGYAFTFDSLKQADNESRVFIAGGVSQKVIDYWHTGWANVQGNSLYKDSSPTASSTDYLMSFSALPSAGARVDGVLCSADRTQFYLVPLSGFADGTKVRGVKISDELPNYVANPFILYSQNTAETLLKDTPSAVYDGVTTPTSINDPIGNAIIKHRVWKGLFDDPDPNK